MPRNWLVLTTLLLYAALAGAYFDEWWHADERVESFFTPPHAVIYLSVFLNGMIILAAVFRQARKMGHFSPSEMVGSQDLALEGTGSLFQLVAGGFDMLYHEWVGFDVSIWSPPHLMAIFGAWISAMGFARLWLREKNPKGSAIGYVFAMAAAFAAGQFALSEYFLEGPRFPGRFVTVPEYYSILTGLFMGVLLTTAFLQTKKAFSTPIMVVTFAFHAVVWILWPPTSSSVTFTFPVVYVAGAVVFDVLIACWKRRSAVIAGMTANVTVLTVITLLTVGSMDLSQAVIAWVGSVFAGGIGYLLAKTFLVSERV